MREALDVQLGAAAADAVAVRIENGIAILSGSAPTLLACDAAAAAAASVRGVRSVVNEIRVTPPTRPDAVVRAEVRAALDGLPAAVCRDVTATVASGVVSLRGYVDSTPLRRAAVHAAAGVRGVVDVRDEIRVRPPRRRPDADIARDVRNRLRWALPLDHGRFDVAVEGGVVCLHGRAVTPSDVDRAEMLAWVEGTREVDPSVVRVDPDAPAGEAPPPDALPTDDAAVAQAVQDALFYDPRVESNRVRVTVEDGVAILRGTVSSLRAQRAAVEDAGATVGVTSVRDLMEVRPAERVSDAQLGTRVRAALARDPVSELAQLRVGVERGEVRIGGQVAGQLAHRRALEVVSGVTGVRALTDEISVAAARRGRRPATGGRR
jgi:osmotically-inducible protein OsmY